jgi:hypothetical protein
VTGLERGESQQPSQSLSNVSTASRCLSPQMRRKLSNVCSAGSEISAMRIAFGAVLTFGCLRLGAHLSGCSSPCVLSSAGPEGGTRSVRAPSRASMLRRRPAVRNTPDLGHRFHTIWDGHSGKWSISVLAYSRRPGDTERVIAPRICDDSAQKLFLSVVPFFELVDFLPNYSAHKVGEPV